MNPRPFLYTLILTASLSCACADDTSLADAGGDRGTMKQDSKAKDDATPTELVDSDAVFVDACTSFNSPCTDNTDPNCGKCQYRVIHASSCTHAAPCDNLLIYWSNFGCEEDKLASVLTEYVTAAPDFIVACVQPLFPGELLPTSLGAPERDDAIVSVVLDRLMSDSTAGVWSGKNLLMAGCSAGASRYPVVAARTAADNSWLGSNKSAVCMSDGVLDIAFQDRFIGGGVQLGGRTCGGRHGRIAVAYAVEEAQPGHRCEDSPGGQCACDLAHSHRSYPGDCDDSDCVVYDSIVVADQGGAFALAPGVTVEGLAIKNWRLISEGSAYSETSDRCEMDVAPKEPYEAFCAAIDATPGARCDFVDRPSAPHCSSYNSGFLATCIEWFRAL